MKIETRKLLLDKYNRSPRGWAKWLRSKANASLLQELVEEFPNLDNIPEMMYWLANGLTAYPVCPTCGGSITKFELRHYPGHCSCRCTQLDKTVRDKYKQTNIERHGDPNYNNPQKGAQTCLERYGVTNVFAATTIKEKIKETNNQRYGVDNPMQNQDIRLKAQATCVERYGVKIGYQIYAPLHRSRGETELADALKNFYPSLKVTDRSQIWPMELDIYIPEHNVGIEYDGDYWHSIPEMIDRDAQKDAVCAEKGVKLIRVLESEWQANRENVIKKIRRIIENNG